MRDMGTLSAATNLQGHAVNGVILGEPMDVDPFTWDWSGPDAEIIDGEVIALDEDGNQYTAAVLVTPEDHAQALADAAAEETAAEAAAEAAAAQREQNIDSIPVIAEAVDELIVAVLA